MNESLARLRSLLDAARPRTTLGIAGPAEVRRIREALEHAAGALATFEAAQDWSAASPGPHPVALALDTYKQGIDRFNASQGNAPLLDAIRRYNHQIVDALHQASPLGGRVVLDVGASPHGYALEQALELGAARYVGIGLDVDEAVRVIGASGVGELMNADAEALPFDDGTFDLVVSMSTFEHVAHVDRCLREIHRVLRPGGKALATFEPIWTCSYGHHLHHFGAVSRLVPDWAHLLWAPAQMRAHLADRWPGDAPLSVDDAVAWVYDSTAINRIGIREMRRHFASGPLDVEWMLPLNDEARDAQRVDEVAQQTGLSREELLTKGLSVLLKRPEQPRAEAGPAA